MPPRAVKTVPNHRIESVPSGNLLSQAVDVSEAVTEWLHILVYGLNRTGKCLGRGTPVLMYDGSIRNVEDVQPGDKLMGPDSKQRTVKTTAVGVGQLYRIVPNKGDSWVCNDAHILTVTGCNGTAVAGKTKDVCVTEYLKDLEDGKPSSDLWCLFRVGVDFQPSDPLRIPPYLVGLWMGDGSRGTASITNSRKEVQDYCRSVAEDMGVLCRMSPDGRPENPTTRISFTTKVGTGGAGKNFVLDFFRSQCSVGLLKTIPQEYLTTSRKDRMELLAGIIDTDGDDTGNSHTTVTVTGEPYRDSLLFLARSLGYAAYCLSSKTHECSSGKVSTYYKVSIYGPLNELPTIVKKFSPRKRPNRHNVTRFEVDDEGVGEYFGFEIDGDGRFLLGDFTVTHNTTLACDFPKPLLLLDFEPSEGAAASVSQHKGVKYIRVQSSRHALELAAELATDSYFQSVVVDSATSYQDMFLRELMNVPKLPEQMGWGTISSDQYRMRSEKIKEGLRPFLALKKHVIVTAKEKDHNPPKEEKVNPNTGKVSPDMRPRFLRGMQQESYVAAELGGAAVGWLHDACDLVTRLYLARETRVVTTVVELFGEKQEQVEEVETGNIARRLRVKWHPNFAAGLRTPHKDCPDHIDNPTYEKIARVMRGEQPE